MFSSNKITKVKPNEIQKVIEDYNLHICKNIWHYSFNDEFQKNSFSFGKRKNGEVVLYSKAYNVFAPLLIYTNSDEIIYIQKDNAAQGAFDHKNETSRNVFWFLRTTTFNDFLERRSKSSSQPKQHFPTLETFEKTKKKINGCVVFEEFSEEFFTQHYDKLRNPDYLTGKEVVENFKRNNPDINLKWLSTAALYHDDSVAAIAALVDDGKSLNLENIAAKRSSTGFGIYLCTEIVKYCCEKNHKSFDTGVTGIYGNYKQRIFLDSSEVYKRQKRFSRYVQILKSPFM